MRSYLVQFVVFVSYRPIPFTRAIPLLHIYSRSKVSTILKLKFMKISHLIGGCIKHAIFTSNLAFEGHQNEQKNDIFVALLGYIIFSEQWRMITLDISQRCIYINFIVMSRREVIIFSGFFYFFMCNAPRYFKIAQMYLYVVHIKWFWRAKWTQKKILDNM